MYVSGGAPSSTRIMHFRKRKLYVWSRDSHVYVCGVAPSARSDLLSKESKNRRIAPKRPRVIRVGSSAGGNFFEGSVYTGGVFRSSLINVDNSRASDGGVHRVIGEGSA